MPRHTGKQSDSAAWGRGRRSAGIKCASGHGFVNGPECLTDLDPSAGLEPENEWMVGLEGASQPSSTVPLLPRRRGHLDRPLPSIRSIPERSISQVTLGPGAWHLASRVGHRRRGVGQSRGRSARS